MTTPTERAILQRRRAAKTGDVLVPILEQLLENEVIPETPEHFRFMDMLVKARALPRRKGVFSPSMLGSCMRQAWFAKRGEEKHLSADSQRNGYFLKGNFVHLQWQFAFWRAHEKGLLKLVTVPIDHELEILDAMKHAGTINVFERMQWAEALDFYDNGTRPGVEVRVVDGDFGGTADVIAEIPVGETPRVIDIKGINLIDFQRTVKSGTKPEYRRQVVGYADNVNTVLGLGVEECIVLSECKAGPLSGRGSPIALHETLVPVKDYHGEMARRLRTLRYHDHTDEMPAIECVSTRHMGYQECAFGGRFCHDEVLAVQRAREADARNKVDPSELKPARPVR